MSLQEQKIAHSKAIILIIDDDAYICSILKKYLEQNGYKTEVAFSGFSAGKLIDKTKFDLVLSDFRLPDCDGLQLLQKIKLKNPATPVIIMTAYTNVKMAVELIKSGAFDYITKPMQQEEVLQVIGKALKKEREKITRSAFDNEFITGSSSRIKEVMRHVGIVAPTEMSVMLEGETGSGKEYIARAIHFSSSRSNMPFVAIDCGSIPRDLANSVLFGHMKGAFTGAVEDKTGFFEEAKGGTLFLDEVGNLPVENQMLILRALQEKVIQRTGGTKPIRVDVRLITASNDNLLKKVKAGEFREDLYHRLNGFKILLPALRDRKEDIMDFTWYFIKKANKDFNKNILHIDDAAEELLKNYYWYGNIRELQNVVNRIVLLSPSDTIIPELLPEEIRHNLSLNTRKPAENAPLPDTQNSRVSDLKTATLAAEKEIIYEALVKTNHNKSKAAKLLRIDRKTLYYKIKLYDLKA
ncbi:MAG: sigma-54-dependent transcriptional regulator [Bacteroidales bacterium]